MLASLDSICLSLLSFSLILSSGGKQPAHFQSGRQTIKMEGEGECGEQVMSEVHLGCPPRFSGSYVTHFSFSLPPKADLIGEKIINLDKEGDLVLARRKGNQKQCNTECQSLKLDDDGDLVLSRKCKSSFSGSICKLTIRHCITSSLSNVGLQVWTAALLLSDFLLHRSFMSSDFDDITALELGAGTGLAGIVLSRIAKKVFLTGQSTLGLPQRLPKLREQHLF